MCRSIPGDSPGLVAYYKMDVSSGNTVHDFSSYSMHGTFRNINPATDWVTSGAAIGDKSVHLYPTGSWQGQQLEYKAEDGSRFWVDSVGINSRTAGVHIYQVEARPNSIAGIPNSQPVSDYFGVFTALHKADNYNINYSSDNKFCSAETYSRMNNEFFSWNRLPTTVEARAAYIKTDGFSREFIVPGAAGGQLSIRGPESICRGSSMELIAETDLLPVWNTGHQGKILNISAPGKYWATVYSGICAVTDTFTVEERLLPAIELSKGVSLCAGGQATLTAPAGFAKYQWSNGSQASSIQVSETGTFWVDITVDDCVYRHHMEVLAEDCPVIPNIITPNGDGLNNLFSIQGIEMKNVRLEIFNRWGKTIYKDNNYKNTWSPSNVAAGIYYYYIKSGPSSREYKGWIEIIK
ncbi:gliding motility-associated C-terminal domain-containing protein [Pontibacter sp. 13R65]|uniref:gliding motility-associated C-terminal domain-containing protein n=1 Tax=Pontibacter sp. 13R65 TaxID=3127458 RepID=UPI00301B8CD7